MRPLEKIDPRELALFLSLVGVGFIIASWLVGNLNYTVCWGTEGTLANCDDAGVLRQQVGFGYAINWVLPLVVLFPIFSAICVECYRRMPRIYARMAEGGMLLDSEGNRVDADRGMAVWRVGQRRVLLFAGLVFVLVTAYIAGDYKSVVGDLYSMDASEIIDIEKTDPELEIDWSVAGPVCHAVNKQLGTFYPGC